MVVNAGSDAVEGVCAVSRDPEMSEEGNSKVSKFQGNKCAAFFYILLTVHINIFILLLTNLMH